ncbi:PREDICTED: protein msta-like [Nicrophorus vespilloides]|uniref:Protein msta-like n=1 Tax=Nicrophorus vespilloides TaxID=110193 RepID=A0ABM1MJ23_NICVS|nr:PREDICTED: protein msta-like [Nicrophorus vespilloides]
MELTTVIKRNEIYGRYLVAAKDLKPGELILKECPLQVGPQTQAMAMCFNCTLYMASERSCEVCGKALKCSVNCKGKLHTREECDTLSRMIIKSEDFLKAPQIILPLRCLLLKQYDAKKWAEFLELESHLKERKDSPIWFIHKEGVYDVLKKLNVDVDEELVQTICGILDVNSFEVRPLFAATTPQECLRGVYLKAALMAHDCTPNTHLSVDFTFEMTIRANRFIPAGETIFYNYANGLQGSAERRKHLHVGKYFDCTCKRCGDGTELQSFLSSLICTSCKSLISCAEPLKDIYSSDWICGKCSKTIKGNLVENTINHSKELINDYSNLQEAEGILEKLKVTLGPNHYIILELKQNMISLLGNYDGELEIKRKIALCEELISVLRLLDFGDISRHLGIALYELHKAKSQLVYEAYNCNLVDVCQYLEGLQEAQNILKESMKHLLYEPKCSPEGKLAQRAMNDLRVLRGTSSDLERILTLDCA